MTRRKILWLSHVLPWPPKTGMLQRSHNLLRHVAKRHEVHLYAVNQRALLPDPEKLREGCEILGDLCTRVVCHPLETDRTRLHWAWLVARSLASRQPYDVHWLRSRALEKALGGAPAGFDLVHVDTLGMLAYAQSLRIRDPSIRIVLNHHNVESQMLLRRSERDAHPARRFYFRNEGRKFARMEAEACPHVDVNLCVSDLDAERLREIAPDATVRVVDNGVDVDYFRSSPEAASRANARRLVFAGGMSWYPNAEAVRFLIEEIWPRLTESDHDGEWRLSIMGADPPASIREAARDPRVEVPGFVEDVRPYLDLAGIYVCPIFDGGGTRLKILDCLAMSKPLVATNLAVEGLDLEEDLHFLRAESAEDFVAQIRRVSKEPELRARLAASGREFVERRFAWDVVGRRLEAAYEAAIESTPRSRA